MRYGSSRRLLRSAVLAALLVTPVTAAVAGQAAARSIPAPADEFFIVSSIDPSKGQLLLKRPTEVTDVMRVDKDTRYVDEHGKAIALDQLRAGDTVFVRARTGSGGTVAIEIRKGPMTIPELQKRYLQRGK